MDVIFFGLLLILGGFVVILLTLVVSRLVSQPQKQIPSPVPEAISPQHFESQDGILLVRTGGHVVYANQPARELFGYLEEQLNLERLARRTRPAEVFLMLCASQGQQRFSLNGRLVDGVSYYVPYFNPTGDSQDALQGGAMLVALHPIQVAVASEGESSRQTVGIFAEINRAMASSLNLESTIYSILESVEKLVAADNFELTIWDPVQNKLKPYRFIGLPGIDRRLEKSTIFYPADQGYSGYLIAQRQPLRIGNVDSVRWIQSSADLIKIPFRSFLGVTLEVAGELIGTLELSAVDRDHFTANDLELLKVFSGQAAISLKNALLFHEEQKRIQELSGLVSLAQAVESFQVIEDLYQRLINTLMPMLPVKNLGFLIFNENEHCLEAQRPFIGIPDPMIDLFKVSIPVGSDKEDLWLADKILVAADAQSDPQFNIMGMDYLAKAAGMQNTILVPLTAAGRQMGYLQAADKQDGTPFDQDDIRLMTIIASQVAAILVNAVLVRESHERAQRSEALRRVASLTGSVATLDEILSFSLREVAHLVRAEIAATYLLDDTVGILRLHHESVYGFLPATSAPYLSLDRTDLNFRLTATGSARAYVSENLDDDESLAVFYRLLAEDLGLQSLIAVPLLIRNQGIGEIILGSKQSSTFSHNDMILLMTTAGQLASAIEKSVLLSQTDESLQRRVGQLLALMRVSREINVSLDLKYLIDLVYNEALKATHADCGSMILFGDQHPSIADEVVSVGDTTVQHLSSVEEEVARTGEALIIENYESPATPYPAPHPGVLSSLILPIVYEGKTAGIIHLHAWETQKFDDTSLEIAQSLSAQAAIALGNVLRYREQTARTIKLNQRIEAMRALLETARDLNIDQSLEQSLEAIALGIQAATPFNAIAISVYDPPTGNMVWVTSAGVPLEKFQEIKEHPNSWHAQDLLIVPLQRDDGQPLGLISVGSPRDGLRPDQSCSEVLGIFAGQASLVIESYLQRTNLTEKVESFEKGIEAVNRVLAGEQRLPTLPLPDPARTPTIHKLDQRARWIKASLDILELANRQETREDALRIVGQAFLTQMSMDSVLIVEPGERGPRLLLSQGVLPTGVPLQPLLGQRNPVRISLKDGEVILVPNLEENKIWKNSPLLNAFNARSFISVPIILEDSGSNTFSEGMSVNAVILAIKSTTIDSVDQHEKHIFTVLGRQLANAFEKLRLLDETNRRLNEVNLLLEFSRQLGSLDTISILQKLVQKTLQFISAAEASMVALWSAEQKTLLPQFASGYVDNDKVLQITYQSGESLPGKVFAEGHLQCIEDLDFTHHYSFTSQQILLYRDATGGKLPVSCLVIPIQTPEAHLGILVLDNFTTPGAFSESDQALVSALTHQTALTLENAALFSQVQSYAADLEQRVVERTDQLSREHKRTRTLLSIITELSKSLDLDIVLNRTLAIVNETIEADHSVILLLQADGRTLYPRASLGNPGMTLPVDQSSFLKFGQVLARWVIQNQRAALVHDMWEDPRLEQPELKSYHYRSALAVPLMVGEDILGSLMLFHHLPGFFSENQLDLIQGTATQISVAINNAQLYNLIRDQAERLGDMLRTQHVETSRSNSILEAVADGVLVTDAKGLITLFNASAEMISGLNRSDILGRSVEDFASLFGRAAQPWVQTIRLWSEEPGSSSQGEPYSEQITTENQRVLALHLSPVRLRGDFLGTVSIFRDITHQVEVDRLKSEFVATVSHELRTPLTSIKGYIEILLMGAGGLLSDQQVHFLQIVKTNTDRLAGLVNDLLDVSRIEAGRVVLSLQALELEPIVDVVIRMLKDRMQDEGRQLTVKKDIPAHVPFVYGDPERVRQIIDNLLVNAYQYTPSGGKILVKIRRVNQEVQVDVKDNGIGIKPEDKDRIFERFFRGDDPLVLASSGTGLGLSIVRTLVEMHKGRIWFESSGVSGEGSTFSFTLPLMNLKETKRQGEENAQEILVQR